jgi:predicted nucleic-acid-binding protein
MIAFDTNLIVRLMVEDDAAQTRRARGILEGAAERGEKVLVTDIVLSEIEWVLDTVYKVPRARILAAVQDLAADERFTFEDRSRMTAALGLFQKGKGDLADYLLGLRGEGRGASTTYTFDRALRGAPPFTVV